MTPPTARELTAFLEQLPEHRHRVSDIVARFHPQPLMLGTTEDYRRGSTRDHLRKARRWIAKTKRGQWKQHKYVVPGTHPPRVEIEYWFVEA